MDTPETTPTTPAEAIPVAPAAPVVPPVAPAAPVAADPITEKLTSLGLSPDQIAKVKGLGAESVDDLAGLTEGDLTGIGVPVLKARKVVSTLAAAAMSAATSAATAAMTGDAAVPALSMLEQLPPDDELLKCTKAGGILKVDRARVVMAGRCLMANANGMLGLDREIVKRIDAHYTDALNEEVPDWFWELSNQVTRKQYAPVFNAMGMPGGSRHATPAARKAFWQEMRAEFLPKLKDVQGQIQAWFQQWMAKAQAMSGLLVTSALTRVGGAPGMAIPASGIPPTNMIVASVEALVDVTSKLFAGTKRAVAIAIETDAKAMRNLLSRNDLHMHMGYASRPVMLKELGIASKADVIQVENIFATYLLNILRVTDMPPTSQTAYFLQELCELGAQLDNFSLIEAGLRTDISSDDDEEGYETDDDEPRGRRPAGIRAPRQPKKNDPFGVEEEKQPRRY